MKSSYSQSYKDAGVDITAGYRAVELMKEHIARTAIPGVMGGLGGFGGMFELDVTGYKKPVLVSGTDGVGTKLKIAFAMDKHDSVGIDIVAMCVNDIVCCGAKPLIFLDYIAMGKNYPEKVAAIVSGIADGCVLAGCALVGGETAEMPGFYMEHEYDLAGFSVGVVEKDQIIDKPSVKKGDVIIALKSTGVHSNGFSLTRKVFGTEKSTVEKYIPELGKTLGEELLIPTGIYVKQLLAVKEQVGFHGAAHITGGGFYENIPRCIPEGLNPIVYREKIQVPPIFNLIQQTGKISEHDMFNTYNMGVGMTVIVSPENADRAVEIFNQEGAEAYICGEIAQNDGGESEVVFV